MSKDAQNWFVGLADVQNAFHQMRILGWLWAFFALPAVLASDVGHSGKKKDRTKTSGSRFFEKSCPYYTSIWVFLGRCFSVKMSRTTD